MDLSHTSPMLAQRWAALGAALGARGVSTSVSSATRTEAQQRDWYRQWLAGTFKTPIVANPDATLGMTPFGWRARGSLHMIQADGYSHALDVAFVGPITQGDFTEALREHGLGQPVPNEPWHIQAWDFYAGVYPWAQVLDTEITEHSEDPDMASLITPDDGDIAVFTTDGVHKAWVRDGVASAALVAHGVVRDEAGAPIRLPRSAIESLILVGPAPAYDATYAGPRTSS